MPVKFECPKCGRRFTEWGAEKNGRKCPDDEWCTHPGEEVELVRVGGQADKPGKKPSLKRSPAKKAPKVRRPAHVDSEDEILAADGADIVIDEEESDLDVEEDEEDIPVVGKDVDEEDEVEIGKPVPPDEAADDEVETHAEVIVDEDVDEDVGHDGVVVDADDETELELGESPLIAPGDDD